MRRSNPVLMFVLIVVVALICVVHVILRGRLQRELESELTLGQRAELQSFMNSTVILPPEWFGIISYSQEVIDRGRENQDLLRRIGARDAIRRNSAIETLRLGEEIPAKMWGRIHRDVDKAKSYTDALIEMSEHPDYLVEAWTQTWLAPEATETPGYMYAVHSLCLRAYAMANRENWTEAFRVNLALHRLAIRHPASIPTFRFFNEMNQSLASECTTALAAQCENVEVMKKALNELNELTPRLLLEVANDQYAVDVVAGLRFAKDQGLDVDFKMGQPGAYYIRQLVPCWPARYPNLDISIHRKRHYPLARALGLGRLVDRVLISKYMPPPQYGPIRERYAVAKYHVALLTLASRLTQLQTGKMPNHPSKMVPIFLPDEPKDPFASSVSDRSYRFDPVRDVFYSLGPDGDDDRNDIAYVLDPPRPSDGDIGPLRPM